MRGYTLPAGNVQISFSGGRTSAYMLHQILAVNGDLPDRVKVVFANTGREMPETLDFVQECSDRWGVPIVWVEDAARGGEALFDVVSHNSASREGEPFARADRAQEGLPRPEQAVLHRTAENPARPALSYVARLGGMDKRGRHPSRRGAPEDPEPRQAGHALVSSRGRG